MLEVRIGKKAVGPGHPVYFIAEAGSNHDGKLDQAKRLVDVAVEVGADAVKFQTFRAEALYPKSAGTTDYLSVPRAIYDILKELEMPLSWIPELAAHCAAQGIDFLSTAFDERSAEALDPFMPAFKIASYEMTHHGLLQHCARKGKPLIVSTGTASLHEVEEAVQAARSVGGNQLVLMQCTAKYPAPLGSLNIRAMETLRRRFDLPVGLSDHSREPLPGPLAAVSLGASVIEKHFTLSNTLPGPDHAYALEPAELKDVIQKIRQVEQALGSGEKEPQPEEEELRRFARRSIFSTRAIGAGERFGVENIAVLRAGKLEGRLHPREFIHLLGRSALRDLPGDSAVGPDDFSEPGLAGQQKVTLRPLTALDGALITRWRSQEDVLNQLFSERPPTLAEHQQWFESLKNRSDRLEFIIELEGRPVGTIGLSAINLGAGSAEYGILIGEHDARGRGIAREASKSLLNFAFDSLSLNRVSLKLFSDNSTARRLYDRLGFVETAAEPPVTKNGLLRQVTSMVLTMQRWRTASW